MTGIKRTMEVTIGTIRHTTGIMEATTDITETQHIVENIINVETMKPRMIERKDPKPQTETRHIMEDTTEKVGILARTVPYLGNGMTTIEGSIPLTDMIEREGHNLQTTTFNNLNLEIIMIETESYNLPIIMIEKVGFEMTDKVQVETSPQKETKIGIGARNTDEQWYMRILNRGGIALRIILLTYTKCAANAQLLVCLHTMSSNA